MRVEPRSTFPELVDRLVPMFGDGLFLPRQHAKGGEQIKFSRLVEDVRVLAAALLEAGIEHGDRIGLIAENRYEWLLADMATVYIGAVDVPRGVDTADTELELILAHSGCRIAFVETSVAAQRIVKLKPQLPDLQRVVLIDPAVDTTPDGVERLRDWFDIGRAALARDGGSSLDAAKAKVTPDDLLTIVYTSGTTAEPKGVMLTHDNVMSDVRVVQQVLKFGREDLILSVLPAWHMYERMVDYVGIACGTRILFTDRRRIKQDIEKHSPTIFAAVPRIWEMIHDGMIAAIDKKKGLARVLLRYAVKAAHDVAAGEAGPLRRMAHSVLRQFLLPKVVEAATGGRMRLAVSGGGALPRHVDACLTGIGVPLLNGYGLTETSPVTNVRRPHDNRVGTIGPTLPETAIEVRSPEGQPLPPGQTGVIWIKGPQVMRGYYKNEERTSRVLRDGWFDSGDLGMVDRDGHVRITGRAKDTIVLAGGENVEPEPLELALKQSELIEQAVIVGQDRKMLGALLVPNKEMLEQQVPDSEWQVREGVIEGERIHKVLRAELDTYATPAHGFRPFERISAFRVLAAPLTPENGLLTATLKVKRHVVAERFADLIESLYSR